MYEQEFRFAESKVEEKDEAIAYMEKNSKKELEEIRKLQEELLALYISNPDPTAAKPTIEEPSVFDDY